MHTSAFRNPGDSKIREEPYLRRQEKDKPGAERPRIERLAYPARWLKIGCP